MPKKPTGASGLRRVMGFKTILLLTLNTIMGTGIYFLPAMGIEHAGPASLISWAIMSVVAVFISMYFAELVSMYPKAGGVYEFAKNAFGEFHSFIIGWLSWIVANVTIAMLIIGGLYYLLPGGSMLTYIAASIMIIVFFNCINYMGMNLSAKMLLFFAFTTVFFLVLFIVPGAVHIEPGNFSPFFVFPLPSIFIAVFFIAETFFGWESTTFLSEETRDAERVMPKALVLSTLIMSVLSISLTLVFLGVVGTEFGHAPLYSLSEILFGGAWGKVIAAAIFIPIIGSAAGWIVTTPRLLHAMSRDRLFIPGFEKIHEKHGIPHNAIIFQTVVTSIITVIGFANYRVLLILLMPLALLLYAYIMLCALKLRISMPRAMRHFKAPMGRVGPAMVAAFCLFLLLLWIFSFGTYLVFLFCLSLIAIGVPLYILVKIRDRKFAEKFYNRISFLYDKTLSLWYGREEEYQVILGAQVRRGDKVLDYGCGTGANLRELARLVGSRGTVVAVDIAEKQLARCVRKVERLSGFPNVVIVREVGKETPFEPGTFDAIVSVGILSLKSDPEKYLCYIHKILKRGGRVSMLCFGRNMIFPAPPHMGSAGGLKSLLEDAGFRDVSVKQKRKLGSRYYFITGRK